MSLNSRIFTKSNTSTQHLEVLFEQTVGENSILYKMGELDQFNVEAMAFSMSSLQEPGLPLLEYTLLKDLDRLSTQYKTIPRFEVVHLAFSESTLGYLNCELNTIITSKSNTDYLIHVIRLYSKINRYYGIKSPKFILHIGRQYKETREFREQLERIVECLYVENASLLLENVVTVNYSYSNDGKLYRSGKDSDYHVLLEWVEVVNSISKFDTISICLDIAHLISNYKLTQVIDGGGTLPQNPITIYDIIDSKGYLGHVHWALSKNFGLNVKTEHALNPINREGKIHEWAKEEPYFLELTERILSDSILKFTVEVPEEYYPCFENREVAREGLLNLKRNM